MTDARSKNPPNSLVVMATSSSTRQLSNIKCDRTRPHDWTTLLVPKFTVYMIHERNSITSNLHHNKHKSLPASRVRASLSSFTCNTEQYASSKFVRWCLIIGIIIIRSSSLEYPPFRSHNGDVPSPLRPSLCGRVPSHRSSGAARLPPTMLNGRLFHRTCLHSANQPSSTDRAQAPCSRCGRASISMQIRTVRRRPCTARALSLRTACSCVHADPDVQI